MAVITSNQSGNWSANATWVGGIVPIDNDSVIIAANHAILMDANTGGFANGIAGITITGNNSALPGMLYWKDGSNGHLRIKSGNNLSGTNNSTNGRLLINSDGNWSNSGNLAYTSKAIIEFDSMNGTYIDLKVYCTQPANNYVTVYYDKYTVSSVNSTSNTITMAAPHGWSANRKVRVKSTGTLPAPLRADAFYYINSPSGSDLKLYSLEGGGTEVDLTDSGSGTVEIYSGYETYAGVTTVNVFEDVSADSAWSTTADHNLICLVNSAQGGARDIQQLTLSGKSSSTVTLSSELDSVQYPGARIYLSSRNVSFRNWIQASYSTRIVYAYNWVLQCEILNTSGGGSQYLLGSNLDCIISGVVNKFDMAVGGGGRINVSGIILSGGYGFYQVGGGTISGTIAGVSSAIANGTTNITISGTIFGCTQAFNGSVGCMLTGNLLDCYYAFSAAVSNVCTGTSVIAACDQIFYQGCSDNLVSSIILNNRWIQTAYLSARNIFRSALSLNLTSFQFMRNGTEGKLMRVLFENFMRTDVQKILDEKGDLFRTTCNGTGDAPSIDPDGGTGYCIEASNIQSNCAYPSCLVVMEEQAIWLTAAAHTVTYKLQTTYSSITAGYLKLTGTYIGTSGQLTEITNAPTITTRSSATDWSQTLAVTFTPSSAGWARFKIELMQYEANDEVYIWPIPMIS
jgi:hypothetical protein